MTCASRTPALGFTLIELMIVMAIIAVLMSVARADLHAGRSSAPKKAC